MPGMGERGPQKLPTKLKLLRGERKASRLNRDAPAPRSRRPVMPAGMTPGAARVWRRVMLEFGATGIITAVDAPILRLYCEAVDRGVEAATSLAVTGALIRGARRGDLIKNPLHQIVRDNADLVIRLARELGLSPGSREGLRNPAAGVDPLDAWMAGSG